jgi:hypothetical protein
MPVLPIAVVNSPFRYFENNFLDAGTDSFSAPTEQSILGGWTQLENVMPVTDGSFQRRRGYSLWSASTIVARNFFSYRNDSTAARYIVATSGTAVKAFNEDGTVRNAAVFSPSGGAIRVRMETSRGFAYFSDGFAADLIKWDGSAAAGTSKWGITAPATAVGVGAPSGGSITLVTGRKYFVVFQNTTSGHASDLSPISASTGPLTAQQVGLSSIEVSADPQVDKKLILATGDGGDPSTLYLLTQLANAVTVYTDNTPEGTLLLQNTYLETDGLGNEVGVSENSRPPVTGILPTKHAGRMWLVDGPTLWFSKSLDEVTTSTGTITSKYEEAWPGDNQIDAAVGAENVRALLSDGQTLYIGTERHIRRISGDNPSNFSTSEICYNETGVMNQDVWKVVYSESQPKGAMWLSPDLRVYLSDYNTYVDVGTPIQDQLNNINLTQAPTKAWAIYVSDKQYDLFLLNVPTGSNTECNRVFVFDLRSKRWVTWTLTDNLSSGLFNITTAGLTQWIIGATTGSLYILDSSSQDRVANGATSFTSTIQTQWLEFGDATTRKVLNEMDIQTGDSGLLVSVEGASTVAEFTTPQVVTSNQAIVVGPLGDYKAFLAGKTSKSRYYRFKFVSLNNVTPVLDSWAVEGIGISRI